MNMTQVTKNFNPSRKPSVAIHFGDPVLAAIFKRGELDGGNTVAKPATKPKAPAGACAVLEGVLA